MRLAGSPEAYGAISRRIAPESVAGFPLPVDSDLVDARLDTFMQMYELLRSKGYSDSAAEHVAVDMAVGRQPKACMTRRFAAIHGQHITDAGNSSPTHREI